MGHKREYKSCVECGADMGDTDLMWAHGALYCHDDLEIQYGAGGSQNA